MSVTGGGPEYTAMTVTLQLERQKNERRRWRAPPCGNDWIVDVARAPQVGFEPTTLRLTVECSDQLSYWGMVEPTAQN